MIRLLRPDWVRLMRNLCSWSASLLDWGGFASLVCPSRLTATIRIVSPHILPSLPAPRACLPACPRPALRTSATDSLAWGGGGGGGSGETGLVGCLVMEGGGSQVDQETRTTVHRGYPLFGVVQPPPFRARGIVPRVFLAPASSRKSWGVPHVHLSLLR